MPPPLCRYAVRVVTHRSVAIATNDVPEWTTFHIRLQCGNRQKQRSLPGLTDGELRWVMQGALAEVERRKAVRETHRKLRVTSDA